MPAEDSRPTKRAKLQNEEDFHPDILSKETRDKVAAAFKVSKPYLHCKIDQLINDKLLRQVRKEIFDNLHFTLKETDIYKVWQTGDLANLDGLPEEELAKLPSIFKLRNALYSQEFRDFISHITDCGPLSGTKADMSINNYLNGCHLLNHDDVIGTRRVSYILYLTDPDERWDPKNGGALELYPVIEKGTPATDPSLIIPPQWNQFVMFTVQPGHSFHSVEEVVPVGKPRLSISGWFHIPQEGEPGYKEVQDSDGPQSSLQQLEAPDSSEDYSHYSEDLDEDATEGLTEDDLKELIEWINPQYLDVTILSQISDKFVEDSVIQCKDFIKAEFAQQIENATLKEDEEQGFGKEEMMPHGTGVGNGWEVHGPPHKHRYLVTTSDTKPDGQSSVNLLHKLEKVFATQSFRRWLAVVTQLVVKGYRGGARRFRPGLDYTLATMNTRGQAILDVTLGLTSTKDKQAAAKWEGDEFGGYECYMAPHDDEEDPSTYKAADEDGALLTLSAADNTLSIVLRDEGVMRFIKYVSARAPGSRWDISLEYDLPEDQNDEEVEDDDKE
ncbi:Oxoglutarate and iron-dependent oxygenase degradation C-term-domain-containing protein [Umbelopsis sp. PMI_123]|nr:Oxoglutarate and iron-dependent oxygenase degradation C-term-domain-containing protein [Umbelopsis sp. PMI_123]